MSTRIQPNLSHTIFLNQDFIPDWINQFYQAKKSEGKSNYTLIFYMQQLGHFLKFCEAQVITRIEEITPNQIRQFLLWHQETGHNPGGQHAAYRVLRAFLLWYEDEVEPENWHNPIRKIKAPKLSEKILRPVEIKDVFSMVDSCKSSKFIDYRDKAILLCLLDSGCRARELLKINIENVNLLDGSVTISGKGNKDRIVFLGKAARKATRRYLKIRTDDNPALFIARNGERLSYGGLRGLIIKRGEQAGVDQPSLHSFRRQFALSMLRAGVNIYVLKELMGHSGLSTLQRYLKITNDDLKLAHNSASPVDRHTG